MRIKLGKKCRYIPFFWSLLLTTVLFGSYLGERDAVGLPPSHLESPLGQPIDRKTTQKTSCDFKVVVSEPDFCVIHGSVRDIDVTLVPIAGVCEGSATLSVNGLPADVKKEILPSPKIGFTKGATAFATIRIDTTNMTLKEGFATSSLTFIASKKGLIRKAMADMKVDLPNFDFSLNPQRTTVQLHQEDSASTTVKVKLLRGGCEGKRSVTLSLDGSSLPSFVSYNFSSESVIPSEEQSILLFKAASGIEIGSFKATLIGCCTHENKKKTKEITVNVIFPRPPKSIAIEEEAPNYPEIEGTFKIDTIENMLKMLQLPEEALELNRKIDEDLARKGYIEVSEEEVQRLKGFEAVFRPMDQVYSLLAFEPVSLENTPFARFNPGGGLPSGTNLGEKWTAVTRIFTMPNGAIIQLIESDLITSGGYSIYAKEAINENINGFPAVFIVEQAASGNAITSIVWTTTTKNYTLEMEGNVKKNGQYKHFLNLAKSIPMQED